MRAIVLILVQLLFATAATSETVRMKWSPSNGSAPWVPGNDYIDGWTENFMNGTVEERGRVQQDGELSAQLMLPKSGKIPAPFIVMLHGCSGMNAAVKAWVQDYGTRLSAAGYGVLALDSFSTRGLGPDGICSDPSQLGWARRRADDAYVALDYLITKGLAKQQQVYVLGRSNGATTTLIIMNEIIGRLHENKFASGFAMQPSCLYMKSVRFYAPVYLHLAEKDEAASPKLCLEAVLTARKVPARATVWKDAYHAYEDRVPAHLFHGYHIGYNRAAAEGTLKSVLLVLAGGTIN
ncbi:dienelactone hydrolase family protein [Bradyrhizobium symbiodeficiens]|uniref:dienelactone hydrolase family protein n=1 Tax=Bradyrhizobium symbiodeficiens TaxID=1404367 RepID=UPI000BA1B75F|nr:dienelactone hydrolase family protein [Bradyrhizobium symbiodeficiens]AWM06077.1 hypothetical protein CIT39_06160 [Bradyrhizobium symbiodeficiens]